MSHRAPDNDSSDGDNYINMIMAVLTMIMWIIIMAMRMLMIITMMMTAIMITTMISVMRGSALGILEGAT